MKTQIYVQSQDDNVTSLAVCDDDTIYYINVENISEMMAIERGVSYVKNMLPYREVVEIYPDKVKSEEILNNTFIKRSRLPIKIGSEITKNKKLKNEFLKNLQKFKLQGKEH